MKSDRERERAGLRVKIAKEKQAAAKEKQVVAKEKQAEAWG